MRKLAIIITILFAISLFFIAKPTHGQETYEMKPAYTVPMPCTQYLDEIEKYHDWDVSMVVRIAFKESKCSSNAVNLTDSHRGCRGSYNILQVGCLHYKGNEDKKNIPLNIEKSHDLYVKAGMSFKDWSTCKAIKGCR